MIVLELKDWKDAENSAREQVRQGLLLICCGQKLYDLAQQKIKQLGGKTLDDEKSAELYNIKDRMMGMKTDGEEGSSETT